MTNRDITFLYTILDAACEGKLKGSQVTIKI